MRYNLKIGSIEQRGKKIVLFSGYIAIAMFVLSPPARAQGQHSEMAAKAVALANQVTDNLNSRLASSFPEGSILTLDERETKCGQVAQAITMNEAIDFMLNGNSKLPDRNTPRYMYADIASARRTLSAGAATYRLARAHAYLKNDCLVQADMLFREVIQIFTGSSFEAYRTTASIGVDDVRDRKKELRDMNAPKQ